MRKLALMMILVLPALCSSAFAQTTAFTYQGSLTDLTLPASGTYDFQFVLRDNDGLPVGPTLTITDVDVMNGVFSVVLDFGSSPNPFGGGADLELEIRVRKPPATAFTPLNPWQRITSSPYAIYAGFAAQADVANHATTATSVSGIVPITAGGTGSSTKNFVDLTTNQTVVGDKTFSNTLSGNVVNAVTQFNIGGTRVMTAPSLNLFVGRSAGLINTSGNSNTFIGTDSGFNNSTGGSNTFVGTSTGFNNSTGSNNTLLGTGTGVGGGNLSFATAIGSGAVVSSSNTVVLGRSSDTVVVPGTLEGLIRAAIIIVPGTTPTVVRQFNNLPGNPTITVTRTDVGTYAVDFGGSVGSRFFQTNVIGFGNEAGGVSINVYLLLSDTTVWVRIRSLNGGGPSDSAVPFVLAVY